MTPEENPSQSLLQITERRSAEDPFPLYRLEAWEEAFEGISAGLTAATADADFSAARHTAWSFLERIEGLADQLGFPAVAWARQVHGAEVRPADDSPQTGFCSPGEADALMARREGLLLLVTVADCVPVYLLEPGRRVVALLHAGWRGTAAGILQRGVKAMWEAYETHPGDLFLHLGPSICGECYEVGPEVLGSLGRFEEEAGGLDLRAELAGQAGALGIRPDRMSTSSWCTRCDLDRFHSHRGSGEAAGRMAAFLGFRQADGSGVEVA